MNARSWSPRRRMGIAAAGLALATAVAVPAVAFAGPTSPAPAPGLAKSSCTVAQRWDALADAAPKVSQYLKDHPDLNTELTKIRSLPKEQRKAETKSYFAAHRDEAAALKQARSALVALHKDCHR